MLQCSAGARILIAGQAPGRRTHAKGKPFADVSGDRLRTWLGVDTQQFYDPDCFAILPMAFCYPGTGNSGDLPPPPVCAETWRTRLLDSMPAIELTVLIGLYAQRWHLGEACGKNLTENVRAWRQHWPQQICLPHPSPRNARWLKQNPYVETELLPMLRARVRELLQATN